MSAGYRQLLTYSDMAFHVRSSGLVCGRTGDLELITFEIRHVLFTVYVVNWKLFFSRLTSVYRASRDHESAQYKSTINIDILLCVHSGDNLYISAIDFKRFFYMLSL